MNLKPSNPAAARADLRRAITIAEDLKEALETLKGSAFDPSTEAERYILQMQVKQVDHTAEWLKLLLAEV